jgi:hypothetical protein
MKVYVASSWRNPHQPEVVRVLREVGHDADLRDPAGAFAWSTIDPDWSSWDATQFVRNLYHPEARRGFARDMEALRACDVCLLVQPCGPSAHLELGWAIGAGKHSLVLLQDGVEPDLMLRMADRLCLSMAEVLAHLELVHRNSLLCKRLLEPRAP